MTNTIDEEIKAIQQAIPLLKSYAGFSDRMKAYTDSMITALDDASDGMERSMILVTLWEILINKPKESYATFPATPQLLFKRLENIDERKELT